MQVVDIVCVNDELELLEFRLATLDRCVDRFVVVEGTRTFTGDDKPLHVHDHRDRFERFESKLDLIVADLEAETDSPWDREHQQNRVKADFIRHELSPEDLVLLGDVDEIPRPDVVEMLRPMHPELLVRLVMVHAEYFANWVRPMPWRNGTLAFPPTLVDHPAARFHLGLDPVRPDQEGVHQVSDAGCHLSGLGGAAALRRKLASYSHQEFFGQRDRAPGHVERCVRYGIHLNGKVVYRPLARAELPPMLEPLVNQWPDAFDFDPSPGRAQQMAWAGWTWLRRRRATPSWLVGVLDRWPGVVVTALLPVFAGCDLGRRAWERWRRGRSEVPGAMRETNLPEVPLAETGPPRS